jgi:uncharacterized protein (DUF3820 family)
MKMPYGKYKNNEIDDIPTSYLIWMLTNTNINQQYPSVAEEMQNQLDAREGKGIDRSGGK